MGEQWMTAFARDLDMKQMLAQLRSGAKEIVVSGLSGSARSMFAATVCTQCDRPVIVVTHNNGQLQKWMDDLQGCMPASLVRAYPAHESVQAEMAIGSPDLLLERMATLVALQQGFRGILVVTEGAARRFLIPRQQFQEAMCTVRVGQSLALDGFIQRLFQAGYVRVPRVEKPGEYSVRGGIVDVCTRTGRNEAVSSEVTQEMTTDWEAYRIEWFGEEIDSIRCFALDTQLSVSEQETVSVYPCAEMIGSLAQWQEAAQRAQADVRAYVAAGNAAVDRHSIVASLEQELQSLQAGVPFAGRMKYVSCLYPQRETLSDYVAADAVWIFDEPTRLQEQAKQEEREFLLWAGFDTAQPQTLSTWSLGVSFDRWMERCPQSKILLSLFARHSPQATHAYTLMCRAVASLTGQPQVLQAEMKRWKKNDRSVFLIAPEQKQLHRMVDAVELLGGVQPERLHRIVGQLQQGFELPGAHLVVLTEKELLEGTGTKRRTRPTVRSQDDGARRLQSEGELRVGDYVVHMHHGIGRYEGIGTLVIDQVHRDYMNISYAGGDKLSIPVDQMDLIQKYMGAEEGVPPKLSKLGGGEWSRAKGKAQRAVQDIAQELIQLYAARAAVRGHAFSPDTPYQQQFETAFAYAETPDQLRAITEIKRDMERSRPMDRLLCGDVGYGKTEVAIRAAFKAVMDGKQVAVLVPTTILAQQHGETFRERFQGLPCRIAVLSRFRSKKEVSDTLTGVTEGQVDICIGTHRLLSADVRFRDLGLLIVDEEQRFGVTHKEKIKKLRTNVDVLTLTATPIPRTLHMAMIGVRDVSVIETPPENRHPVQTYVLEFRWSLVQEAIERELARQGQVYVVHNRIEGIERLAQKIRQVVPDARIVVAHGRMKEDALERTILDFLDGEYDVLVSTSIIETGVDIPNVNTLIVYDADHMGLSQLYQLRGRVGRSNRMAYAYFTYQPDKSLKEASEKRLQAIREFTELGSGFKIAMRDLAIRGAGNLLGGEQHGFIASVGFHLYTQMLTEEMERRKRALPTEEGHDAPPPGPPAVVTKIEMKAEAYIPGSYIDDHEQKIEVYQQLALCKTLERLEQCVASWIDRFGDFPPPVDMLVRIARLRIVASYLGIQMIALQQQQVQFEWHADWSSYLVPDRLVRVCHTFSLEKVPLRVVPQTTAVVQMDCKKLSVLASVKHAEALCMLLLKHRVVENESMLVVQ